MPAAFNKSHAFPRNHGKTNAQVVTGPGTLFDGLKEVKKPTKGTPILALESDISTVWWTKPADLPSTPGKPPELFGKFDFGSCWVVFTDGKVQQLHKKDDAKRLPELIRSKN